MPEPPAVIEVRTRRGGSQLSSGHTSIQPHFGEFNIRTLFVIGLNLCEPCHWLTDERRLTNEKTHINLDQSQTESNIELTKVRLDARLTRAPSSCPHFYHRRLWHPG